MQFLLLVACLASTASIALTAPSGWSPDTAEFYSTVAKEIKGARKTHSNPRQSPSCDFSRAKMPSTDEPLPSVPGGQKLLHVTIGRGIQNYTCSSSSATDKPKATGALATLFEASCLASTYPFLLSLLPNIALRLSNPAYPTSLSQELLTSFTFGPSNLPIAGYHFFDSAGVPVFDLLKDGHAAVEKIAGVPAPKGALDGVGKQKFGAVPWLYLAAVEGSAGKAKSVYRVGTAGGKSPETCEGWKGNDGDGGVLSVQYAAEYWFFG
ncbi:hypothetical protein AJ78_01719 [Emergomyces pasteurianus Ep9510]|uniref:Malate dehydrogenase n=1 Tax=Emergomyces pasteurianus Ep9510 TaxID=1447872 RepID=A0A1J9QDD6_9EURO|nr:hypothetical protein AJ78_01719 [Emergomyces pasteurianus Ep9510]